MANLEISRPTVLFLALCYLACLGAGAGTALANSPGFQILDREPAITARTLAHLADLAPDEAEQRKIWVFFTDKGIFDSTTCARELAQVAAELDSHAATRRAKVLGPDLTDFHDIPVVDRYVAGLRELGAETVWGSRWLNAVSVRAPLAALAEIGALPHVQKLVLVKGGRLDLPVPADVIPAGGKHQTFDYGPSLGQLEEITITDAHAAGFSGAGIVVAMLDTGFYQEHEAFAQLLADGRLLGQWDFVNDDGQTQNEPGDPEGQHFHGTLTWSIVSGFFEGELIGGAYGAAFLLAKTEDTSQEVPQEEDNWVAGAEWADGKGADVINSSLGYKDWYTYEDMDGNTAVTTIAADIAVGRGIVVCTSAGNWGTQDWYYISAPADGDSVVAVGGTRPDGEMWDQSSHGPTYDGRTKPEVCARGDDTYAAVPPGTIHGNPDAIYYPLSGTSVASPLVASAAALILEAHPEWTPMMVRERLMMTADNAETPDNWRGWGRIDAMAAIGEIVAAPEVLGVQAPRLSAWPNPTGGEVRFRVQLPAAVADEAVLEIYTVDGKRVRRFARLPVAAPVRWDGRDERGQRLPAGTYLARLRAGEWRATGKVILSR